MMTVKKLNEYADNLETEGIVSSLPNGAKGEEAAPEVVLGKVCDIYKKVRPFFEFLSSPAFFFIPKKWRASISTFMMVLDGLCPPVIEE